MTEQKTYGTAWCEGGDPEDGGWRFDGGGEVGGYDVAYNAGSREEASDLGVPDEVLDLFEKGGGVYAEPGGGLFDWLQQNVDLFRQ